MKHFCVKRICNAEDQEREEAPRGAEKEEEERPTNKLLKRTRSTGSEEEGGERTNWCKEVKMTNMSLHQRSW